MKPQHIKASTMHRRLGGEANSFRYDVDYLLIEPEKIGKAPALFSANAANLVSYHDLDHGGVRGAGQGAQWVRDRLGEAGIAMEHGWRILLLAQPRMLGTRFTPVSFWMIVDEDEALRAVIAEVNNTFGDRHSYLCAHPDAAPILPSDEMVAQKVFHVSPFQPVAGEYRFHFALAPGDVSVRIDYRHGAGGLLATLYGGREDMTSFGLLASLVRRPFGSLRVVALIHWQALRLWHVRAVFHRRPAPPAQEVSR
jgi:DUF1365 family protein